MEQFDGRENPIPPMTSAQQMEVLRLAARLQAEHEMQTDDLLRAAAEAGIERRFLDAAVSRVTATRPRQLQLPSLSTVAAGLLLMVVIIGSALTIAILPLIGFTIALSLIAALFPVFADRNRLKTFAFVAAAWLVLDALFALARGDVRGEFTNVGVAQLAGTLIGIELARLIYRLRGKAAHPNDIIHQPQSQ